MLFRFQLSEDNYTNVSTRILSSKTIMTKKQENICFKKLANKMILTFTNGISNTRYKLYLYGQDGSVVEYNSLMDESSDEDDENPIKFNQGYKFEKL